jgi:hypothetical protein
VIEIHGRFDPINELSANSYSSVKEIKLLENDEQYSVAEIMIDGKKLFIAQCNRDFGERTKHSAQGNNWTGPFTILYDGKTLN